MENSVKLLIWKTFLKEKKMINYRNSSMEL